MRGWKWEKQFEYEKSVESCSPHHFFPAVDIYVRATKEQAVAEWAFFFLDPDHLVQKEAN